MRLLTNFAAPLCAALLMASPLLAQAPAPAAKAPTTAVPTENDPMTARREIALSAQLRCLVCQNQSIAESNAELAQDLRRQVREQVAAGKTDAEIIDFMTSRYGDFVLYRPPFRATTLLLWLGPLLLLLAAGAIAWRVVRARRSATVAVLSDEERKRAAQLLGGEGGRS
jgi:cytochrome c-type biogenesis protein CcmH